MAVQSEFGSQPNCLLKPDAGHRAAYAKGKETKRSSPSQVHTDHPFCTTQRGGEGRAERKRSRNTVTNHFQRKCSKRWATQTSSPKFPEDPSCEGTRSGALAGLPLPSAARKTNQRALPSAPRLHQHVLRKWYETSEKETTRKNDMRKHSCTLILLSSAN